MQVGIIGAGRFGSAAARTFTRAGVHVLIANRRGRVSLMPLVQEVGFGLSPVRPDEAVRAPMVVLAVPYGAAAGLLAELDDLEATVVVDATNDWGGDVDSTRTLAGAACGGRWVKALNTLHANRLAQPDGLAAPVAGDDRAAVDDVCALVTAIGFAPVRAGSLADAGPLMAPGGALFGRVVPAEVLEREISGSR